MDNLNLQQNIDISNLSWFKTKAFSKYYFELNDQKDILKLKEILNFAKQNNLQTLFVWDWTNLLFAFEEFKGIIIKNNLKWFFYDEKSKILEVYSAEKTWKIAERLENDFKQNIWHRFIWLPGSIGWAVFWNAWCFWLEAESNFLKAEVYNLETWEIEILDKNSSNFSYRNSIFKQTQKYFIIKIKFDLSKVIEKYPNDIDNIKFREEVQPKWNSCGSFFKNYSKELSAGYMLQQVWLKWFCYKNAYFSDKHANFLMTKLDNWDYKDLLYLVDLAKQKVKNKFWIELHEEVRIIKNK